MAKRFSAAVFVAVLLGLSAALWADGILIPQPTVEAPQPRPLPVKWHRVNVEIKDQVAQTAIDQVFLNESARDLEATYLFPLPEEAAISEFAMFMDDHRVTGEMLERDEARRIYEDIVRQMRDPALLEYVSRNLFRASVYPVPAKGEKRIQLQYSQVLALEGGICKYVYPLGIEKYSPEPLEEVTVSVSIESRIPIKAIYSPTHKIDVHRKDDTHAVVGFEAKDVRPDQDFVLYYTVSQEDFGLSLITHREAGEDGFFLMLVAPKEEIQQKEIAAKDIVFVFDTSGSMAGEKIKQAREALRFCVGKLGGGDRFSIVTFATDVETFDKGLVAASAENVEKAKAFIDGIEAVGGTNIDAALKTALGMIEGDRPSMVLFLTDGMPTVGETDEGKIVENVAAQNGSESPVAEVVEGRPQGDGAKRFSLDLRDADLADAIEMIAKAADVGVTVRGDLGGRKVTMRFNNVTAREALRALADAYGLELGENAGMFVLTAKGEGATQRYVRERREGTPAAKRKSRIFVFGVGDDVNTHLLDKVSGGNGGDSDYVAPDEDIEVKVSALYSKIAYPVLSDITIDFGDVDVHDYYPRELPDLFKGAQLTLFGRYKGKGNIAVKLAGHVGDETKSFAFDASFPQEETANPFIARLWAMRKIGSLLDEIRLHGETKELTDSIVALATKYGIMTPYTSFLVQERKDTVAARARDDIEARGLPEAQPPGSGGYGGGYGAYGPAGPQGPPAPAGMPGEASGRDAVTAAKHIGSMEEAEDTTGLQLSQPVQTVDGKTFYFDGETWVDNDFDTALPAIEIQYMSDAYFALLNARPEWGKIISLGEKVTFRVGDEVIKIGDAGKETLTEEELQHLKNLGK